MFLVTNPVPTISTQPSQILVSNSNGVLQLLPQPTNSFNTTYVIQNLPQNIPGYIQTPILGSLPAYQQQIQLQPMNTFSTQAAPVVFRNYGQNLLQQNSKSIITTNVKQEVQFDKEHRNCVSSLSPEEINSKSEVSDSVKPLSAYNFQHHTTECYNLRRKIRYKKN